MAETSSPIPFDQLRNEIDGDIHADMSHRLLYATDASVFREIPAAICIPAHSDDLKKVLAFCRSHQLPVIPRTAGTSLAGQVVGHGMVLDFSHMDRIIALNTEERWVKVQPGVILDDLNRFLESSGLFFGPEASTSNRCMIGGMVANNACGAHSLVYGSTRDHTLGIKGLLANGEEVSFGPLDSEAFRQKCIGSKLENKIYQQIFKLLSDPSNHKEIRQNFPHPNIKRRNTGYALDLLLNTMPFGGDMPFNFSQILSGSEGTLAIFTEIKLNLVPLPPPEKGLVCVHLKTVEEALQANLIALKHGPAAVELMDHHILERTAHNLAQAKNRFFIQGEPGAILIVEFARNTRADVMTAAREVEAQMKKQGLGYHFPLVTGKDMPRVWALRKAGLGLLSNTPGDAKPVSVIEDTAVDVARLPDFIKDVKAVLNKLNLSCVYHAHIGTGELHLRPLLNLKSRADIERFHQVGEEVAFLVRKHKGSLSGEHGDGRLRGFFIPIVLGEACYEMLRQVKRTWDPEQMLNPGKITDTPSIKTSLRYTPGQETKKIKTFLDFSMTQGIQRALEQCNGSGDCRKPQQAGGVMCPSYHATRNEYDSTRGRANLLREFITNSTNKNPFAEKEVINVLDLCLSCKACKSECPSNVDMAAYKAEAYQHYYLWNGTPNRAKIIGAYAKFNKIGSKVPGLFNFFAGNKLTSPIIKSILGFSNKRKLPSLQKQTWRKWASENLEKLNRINHDKPSVLIFCDEFTNYNDTEAGIEAILLLHRLGYQVLFTDHEESGRAAISKGLLIKAQKLATHNVKHLFEMVSEKTPMVGIEPSATLCFRDEYPSLLRDEMKSMAEQLAANTYTFEEFISNEAARGHIQASSFNSRKEHVYIHGHCHQKSLSGTNYSHNVISLLPGRQVHAIECGCCGMAGAFGFEKKHYDLSMEIGELALFPAIRKAEADAIIAASGTSCRQQILDGTGRKALHPAQVLYRNLRFDTAP